MLIEIFYCVGGIRSSSRTRCVCVCARAPVRACVRYLRFSVKIEDELIYKHFICFFIIAFPLLSFFSFLPFYSSSSFHLRYLPFLSSSFLYLLLLSIQLQTVHDEACDCTTVMCYYMRPYLSRTNF